MVPSMSKLIRKANVSSSLRSLKAYLACGGAISVIRSRIVRQTFPHRRNGWVPGHDRLLAGAATSRRSDIVSSLTSPLLTSAVAGQGRPPWLLTTLRAGLNRGSGAPDKRVARVGHRSTGDSDL